MTKEPCTYILASGRMGTLYVGVTSNLAARLHQHRTSGTSNFTGRYGVAKLVRYERFEDMPSAIAREKQLKRWRRDRKINLVEQYNPHWLDLAPEAGPAAVGDRPRADGGRRRPGP